MQKRQTEILIIGGGATGTGLARDLSMRGFRTILVERRDLTDGTTGRYHGLLHSGGRYAVKDPIAASECIVENQILRHILPTCIEDTGGFFVLTPEDDAAYIQKLEAGCRQAGIPCEALAPAEMLRQEPLLNPRISYCLRVPDGAADSFLAGRLNAESARQYGAEILRYHPVQQMLLSEAGKRIRGVVCQDLIHDEPVEIRADLVINAAGAWAGKIAALAGITVHMIPGKGTMLAVNHRIVHTVINRCKMPGDGDILVPAHTVAVIGTTDIKVADPDAIGIEAWEVQLMLDEGEKLIPGFKNLRFLRAWAGVRPLYQETSAAHNRDVTRAFVLLDHATRDGVEGILTITGGKWTTYRKMAEVTADKACEKLGVVRACRTHLEPVSPESGKIAAGHAHHILGHRLAQVEADHAYGELLCECEFARREDVAEVIAAGAATLDDVRRALRLGMGPCQGGFCSLRAAGLLHQSPGYILPSTHTNASLRDFLQERWKGLLPVLWGQQLRQERLNELIYVNVLNAGYLPGPQHTSLASIPYQPTQPAPVTPGLRPEYPHAPGPNHRASIPDLLIIGGGLAGLSAAWQAAMQGQRVKLITAGWGATHWGAGCIDLLGYVNGELVEAPAEAIGQLPASHPYSLVTPARMAEALQSLQAACNAADYPLHGDPGCNWLLPTASGAARPTCLAPESMVAGDLHQNSPMRIVGFTDFLDFWPEWIAANLSAQGVAAEGLTLDLPAGYPNGARSRNFVNGMLLARMFDDPQFRTELANALRPHLGDAHRVGFPAVLGLEHPMAALHHLQDLLELPVFEIPGLPPSIPGIRLQRLLVNAARQAGAHILEGLQVVHASLAPGGRQIEAVWSEAAARPHPHRARRFLLATGGFLGGGITLDSTGYAKETALNLPVPTPAARERWFSTKFLDPPGHPIFRAGLTVNPRFQPLAPDGEPHYENLFAAGGILAGFDSVRELSLDGVALVSGMLSAQASGA